MISKKNQRWAEIKDLVGVPLRVTWELVDYGDDRGRVEGLQFRVSRDLDASFGGGITGSTRQAVTIGLDDLRELVRLADEEPEVLGKLSAFAA